MTDAIWNSMTGEVETPCGSVFMTVDWDYEEKELTLNNLAHIFIHFGKEGVCLSNFMDIFADNMLGSIKSTAHKRVVLNNMIEGYRQNSCHREKDDDKLKSCTKAISHLLDKFFPEEKKEGNEKK